MKRSLLLSGFLCLAGTISLSAGAITISGTSSTAGTCAAGDTGTFMIDSSGGILLETSGTGGCYVGGFNSGGPTGADTTYIDITPLTTEGTALQLQAMVTGWYAEYGAICGGPGQCTASNSSGNGNNSGDIEVLLNSGGSSVTFQVQSSDGAVDSIGNLPSAVDCGGNGTTKTFTIAAHTVCLEDLSTGGSISIAIDPPPSVPEPSSMGLFLIGGTLIAAYRIRRPQ